ncbi:hypothetical protein [Rubrimonas cliftonensis]|uniref:Uncharacterized protein n=1 Tax=Rubrimonas cliftonensis TaxID=89524 RepID=A0A1H3YZM5_9RHOB|nr:hypothetical protein [Rubrimonas cliftonensis]SEA16965.1 hypothetical protein SAMN05444370_103321 [Rubrimonas cliftonensis]
MHVCETCLYHDRPEALIAAAMSAARALAAEIAAAEHHIEPKLRGVANTVRRMAEDRRITDRMFGGPLASLVERLDRAVTDATRTVMRTVERGHDADGPIFDYEPETVIDPAAAPLAAVLERARAVSALIDRARDIAAADEAVIALREGARRG